MLVEIPDNQVPMILKGIQSIYDDLEYNNPAQWVQTLNSLLNEQFKHEIKLAFENAIDKCFSNIQASCNFATGGISPGSKLSELQDKFIDECIKAIFMEDN